jgi:hypothetical protein
MAIIIETRIIDLHRYRALYAAIRQAFLICSGIMDSFSSLPRNRLASIFSRFLKHLRSPSGDCDEKREENSGQTISWRCGVVSDPTIWTFSINKWPSGHGK